jgi:uncharacterized protein involved in exopolysaccharide biosynthesis
VAAAPGPPSPTAAAIGKHKWLVVACAVAFAAMGVAIGVVRKDTYTAAATLQVGKVNPNSPGFYGFVQSASQLATAFSRAITAGPVLSKVHKHLGLSPGLASARLSAAPIPSSPAFRVIATGPSQRDAIHLANVTSGALIAYEAQANTYNPETKRLLHEYHSASLKLAQADAKANEAAHEYALYPYPKQRAELQRAQAARAAASLEAQVRANNYQLSAQSTTTGLLSLLAGAQTASSDRSSKIQLLGFIGLLGGAVIGCALAVAIERGHGVPRRRLRLSFR